MRLRFIKVMECGRVARISEHLATPAAHCHRSSEQLLIGEREQRDSRSYGLAVYVLPG